MAANEIGIVLDSFHQPTREALESAAGLAFRQIELPTIGTDVEPSQLSASGRRHLRHHVNALGLRLTALAWIPMLDVSANTSVSATRRLPLGGAHFC